MGPSRLSRAPHRMTADEAEDAEGAGRWAQDRLEVAGAGSAEEIFLQLLVRASHAHLRGDYAIAAAVVVRSGGLETVCFGESTLFSQRDPTGHAEINALRQARAFGRGSENSELDILIRRSPGNASSVLLFSTLEPCPMCSVAILNSGVSTVCVAHDDPDAGTLLRMDSLTPVWPALGLSRRLQVLRLSGTEGVLAREILSKLDDLFRQSKRLLDDRLNRRGVLDMSAVAQRAADTRMPRLADI